MNVHLPSVAEPSARLLEDFARPLLAALARHEPAAAISAQLARAADELGNVLRSRELCERLTLRADTLAEREEQCLESEIRALYQSLSRQARVRSQVFPSGLGGALSPRGDAQVIEARRLLGALGKAAPPAAVRVAIRLAVATDSLASRLSAATAAHASLLQIVAAELRQQRLFRAQYHVVYGALVGLFVEDQKRVSKLFRKTVAAASRPAAFPTVPAPVSSLDSRRAKRSAGRRKKP